MERKKFSWQDLINSYIENIQLKYSTNYFQFIVAFKVWYLMPFYILPYIKQKNLSLQQFEIIALNVIWPLSILRTIVVYKIHKYLKYLLIEFYEIKLFNTISYLPITYLYFFCFSILHSIVTTWRKVDATSSNTIHHLLSQFSYECLRYI